MLNNCGNSLLCRYPSIKVYNKTHILNNRKKKLNCQHICVKIIIFLHIHVHYFAKLLITINLNLYSVDFIIIQYSQRFNGFTVTVASSPLILYPKFHPKFSVDS